MVTDSVYVDESQPLRTRTVNNIDQPYDVFGQQADRQGHCILSACKNQLHQAALALAPHECRDHTVIDGPRDGRLKWQSGVIWERGSTDEETPLLEVWLVQSQNM